MSWLFCGGVVAAWPACRGAAFPDVRTGVTTFSFHWEAEVAGGVSRAPCTFMATSSLFAAWLTYGSRSLLITVCGRAPCADCGPDACMAPDRSAYRKCNPECWAAVMVVACWFAVSIAATS